MSVAVVTGAASGIGAATVGLLAERGWQLVAVDLDPGGLAALLDDRVCVLAGDVCDLETNDAMIRTAVDRFGRLDAVVLNAGVAVQGDLLELPIEAFDRSIDVNLRAVLLGMRAAVAAFRRTGGAGRIVVTASTSGLGGDPSLWAYNAAKAGVINLVRAAAIDLAAEAITVNAVCPGPTETGMTANVRAVPAVHDSLRRAIPMQRWGQPGEIAEAIAFLVSPAASFITGVALPVDGGITANTGQFTPRPQT